VRRLLLAVAVLLALAAPATASAQGPRASLADLEDEVMCVECGTPLEVSQSPVANQERAFIRRQIAQGRDKAQIKAALVAEYGDAVLAEPRGGGFDLAAWLIPILVAAVGIAAVAASARRWRRAPTPAPADAPAPAPALDPAAARRLDAELEAFDR
jgi:cytochrome c-type biogenesis protein CcmH